MRKLKITYWMKKNKWDSVESYIEIPCTEDKYIELMKAGQFNRRHLGEPFTKLNKILGGICKLQGYKLEGYQFEES